ncbi:MAG: hypothetical protein KJ698_03715 [Actinobacteria bacterium]|nr:hypothetical protein [Actinomycetota bacterium]MBU1492593.1 hypothetical protein [Actinomycetota bacterium]
MRAPNPWIAVPVLVATIGGAVIGFQVTRVSCAPGSCLPSAIGIGLLAAAAALVGVGTVMVLAMRSIAEWREQQERGGPPPSPGEPGPPTC